jgi:hypothetical protein
VVTYDLSAIARQRQDARMVRRIAESMRAEEPEEPAAWLDTVAFHIEHGADLMEKEQSQ